MKDRPNILLITTDQHHYKALGVHTPVLSTPNLDRLAAEGALLTRAYCPNPVCSPSRSSIITGTYPSTHGCWTIGTKLDEKTRTLGQILTEAGYATSLIGKAHFQPLATTAGQTSIECPPYFRNLSFWQGFHGPYYGFQHIELARNHADEAWAGQHYGIWLEEHGLTNWESYFQSLDGRGPERRHIWDLPESLHYSSWTAERTTAAIRQAVNSGTPFFTWASFQDPHPPYLTSEPWATMYSADEVQPGTLVPGELERMPPWYAETQKEKPDFSRWQETPYLNHGFTSHLVDESELRADIAVYYGMISFVDAKVGSILQCLEDLGIAENTLVIFATDHGHFLGQHGLVAKGPFHYEDMIRIPMIVRMPNLVPAGKAITALQSLVDIAPTVLACAGLPRDPSMQGVNQMPVWSGYEPSARDHVIVENRHQPTRVHVRTYVEEQYKLTLYRGEPWGELFDLEADPDERWNLFDDPSAGSLRSRLVERFLRAELSRERSQYERIALA